jgi:serine/threonine protein kinase
MTSEKKVLTLQTVAERKEAKRLTFSDGRYITRGNPRSGGIASVYRATDADTGNTVALKIFRSGDGTDEVIEESFRREVQALTDLSHPNVVRILNSGRDEVSAIHFIAMEWIEQDLKSVCESSTFASWDSFFEVIGKGILDGLVFAHSRSTVHRDIKPSNILVAEDGHPIICDFGISKIRNYLAPGVTLAQFASAPYSPSEEDDGSYSYSRDVFGFAALAIASLSKTPLHSNTELLRALEDVTMDDAVRRLLRRCLSLEHPELRPQNAVVLLGEIERIQPEKQAPPKGVVLFSLTKRVREIVEYDLGLRSDATDRFVERDLDGVCCEEIPVTTERPDQSFRLFGHKYSYTAVKDESSSRLVFVNALEHPQSELEKKRDFSCAVDYKFSAAGSKTPSTIAALEGLCEHVVAYTAAQKTRKLE